jgi:hypothetical protein
MFNFADPFIDIFNNDIVKNYEKFKENDKIFIWAIIDQKGSYVHMVAHVVTAENEHFSFGFGYYTDSKSHNVKSKKLNKIKTKLQLNVLSHNDSSLYLPDYLFEKKILQQLTKPQNTYLKLIASSELKLEHLNTITKLFDKITYNDMQSFNILLINIPESLFSENQKNINRQNNESIIEDLELISDKIKENKTGKIENNPIISKDMIIENIKDIKKNINSMFLIKNTILFNIKSLEYCTLSGSKNTHKANCSSFLYKIFNDFVSCGSIINYLIVAPKNCFQRRSVKPINCRETVDKKTNYNTKSTKRLQFLKFFQRKPINSSTKQKNKRSKGNPGSYSNRTNITNNSTMIEMENKKKYYGLLNLTI